MVTDAQWQDWDGQGRGLGIDLGIVEERGDRLLKDLAEVTFGEATGDPAVLRQLARGLSAAVDLKLAVEEADRILAMLQAELGPPPDAQA